MEDTVSKATKAAIRHAKCRKSRKVNTDDILMGIFQVISRFDIIHVGHLTFDLQDFIEFPIDCFIHDLEDPGNQKVSYSSSVNDLFEKAADIARKDNSPKVKLIHILVAFTDDDNGLMGQLKSKYGFSGGDWRIALSNWQPYSPATAGADSKDPADRISGMDIEKKLFFSPDEAADFLSVHVQTIRGYIRMGKLPAMRLAGERALRIKQEDLLALLEPFNPDN